MSDNDNSSEGVPGPPERRSLWKRIRSLGKRIGFTGLSALAAVTAIGVSIWVWWDQDRDDKDQNEAQEEANRKQGELEQELADARARFDRAVEERQSAPLLITYRREQVPDALVTGSSPPEIRVRVRNVGEGVAALTREYATLVADCGRTPGLLGDPLSGLERASYYVVRPGESQSLVYHPRPAEEDHRNLVKQYRWASGATHLNVLLRYTDLLGRRLRWTCLSFSRRENDDPWSYAAAFYDDRPLGRKSQARNPVYEAPGSIPIEAQSGHGPPTCPGEEGIRVPGCG
jgi:hypothetical protein